MTGKVVLNHVNDLVDVECVTFGMVELQFVWNRLEIC